MQYGKQVSKLDCGISVIQVLYKHFYHEWLSLSSLKNNVNYDVNGINLMELIKLAKKFGIYLEVLKGDFEAFKKIEINQPVISIIKNDGFLHYILIEKITSKNNVIYFDPILGKQKVSINEFEEKYFGIIINCYKSKIEKEIDKNKTNLLSFDFLREQIWISISSILIMVMLFVGSYYMKILLDQVISSNSFNNLLMISISFIFIMVVKLLLGTLNEFVTQKIELKLQNQYISEYIEKLSSVKWEKISYLDESMHLKNLDMIIKISSFKSKYMLNILTNSLCLIFSGIFLVVFEVKLFLISLLVVVVMISLNFLFRKKFQSIEIEAMTNSTTFKKSYFNIINGLDQFKLNSTKEYLKNSFGNNLYKVVNAEIKASNITLIYNFIQSLLKNIIPFVIVILLVLDIWKNDLSLGQLFLFLSMFNFFINPFSIFTSIFIEAPIIKKYLENINAFFDLENENSIEDNKLLNDISNIHNIKLENVNFKYKEGFDILKINYLEINSKVNVIGKNGSGKSTLLKLVSTLIISSNIQYNNKNINFYNLDSIRKQICFLSNNEYLPYGTIYDYLLSSSKENLKCLLENIDKYNLLSLFEDMGLNLSSKIDEGGKNLSSGQKQFISIMKIFSYDFSLILLDEAFENIDNEMLNKIFSILRKHLESKIVIEISHRKNYLFEGSVINCEQYNK